MTPTEVAAILRQFNEWRRGDYEPSEQPAPPDPREISEAIDAAVEMIDRLEAAEKERDELRGMPEFDGLLDHIYEHGTAAEGVIEKANAFARAVIARYAPQQPANDEVVFIDGVGAGRRSVESCRDGVQWIMVGDRVYWPLSESDAKRLQSACCGNGHFDGPSTHVGEGEQQ